MTKKCDYCGKEFERTGNYQKYCSPACRSKGYRQRNREYINEYARQYRKKHTSVKPKYPCYRYMEYNIFKIPDEWCLNCYAPKCRFDNG